jgi:hypothetical protein
MPSGVLEVVVAEASHGQPLRGIHLPAKDRTAQGKFGLMFPERCAFRPPEALLKALAGTMKDRGGGPDSSIPSGFTFLSQFVDHDLTHDKTPLEQQLEDPDGRDNFSSPRFDLDSVYGGGPDTSPDLYDPNDRDKLLLAGDDLPRKADGTAFIADSRNEENLIICQLQIAFVKFHNRLVDHVRAGGTPAGDVFGKARQLARWHYQWIVLHDLLPRLVGRDLIDSILTIPPSGPATVKLDFYEPTDPDRPMMPVEFAAAAYRFGHSMLRIAYQVNRSSATLFRVAGPDEHDLNGFRPIPRDLEVVWRNFFEIPGVTEPPANHARRIDTRLSLPLFALPDSVVRPPDTDVPPPPMVRSLAERNLIRGAHAGLPSGQGVAHAMAIRPLTNAELEMPDEPGWNGQAPLWYYILKEAELQHGGERLGVVGARIVAEVFLGLLHFDKESYLNRQPSFRPRPPIAPAEGQFRMGDLLLFAGAAA